MAEINKQSGEIILTEADRDALQNGVGKNHAKDLINYIIWGDVEYFYE